MPITIKVTGIYNSDYTLVENLWREYLNKKIFGINFTKEYKILNF